MGFVELTEAYSILSDPELRSQYDGGRTPEDLQRSASKESRGRHRTDHDRGDANPDDQSRVDDALDVFYGVKDSSGSGRGDAGGCAEGDFDCGFDQMFGTRGEEDRAVPEHCCLPAP